MNKNQDATDLRALTLALRPSMASSFWASNSSAVRFELVCVRYGEALRLEYEECGSELLKRTERSRREELWLIVYLWACD